MAVVNAYVNQDIVAGTIAVGAAQRGQRTIIMRETFEKAAADSSTSVYRVFKGVNAFLIPVRIEIENDAITGATAYSCGLYQTNLGAVISKNVFATALDFSSARATGSPISGMSAQDQANAEKALYELAGDDVGAIKNGGYDLCLTADTAGTGAGTITVTAAFIEKF